MKKEIHNKITQIHQKLNKKKSLSEILQCITAVTHCKKPIKIPPINVKRKITAPLGKSTKQVDKWMKFCHY